MPRAAPVLEFAADNFLQWRGRKWLTSAAIAGMTMHVDSIVQAADGVDLATGMVANLNSRHAGGDHRMPPDWAAVVEPIAASTVWFGGWSCGKLPTASSSTRRIILSLVRRIAAGASPTGAIAAANLANREFMNIAFIADPAGSQITWWRRANSMGQRPVRGLHVRSRRSLHAKGESARMARHPGHCRTLFRARHFNVHATIRLQAGDQRLGCFPAFAVSGLGHGL